MIQIGDTVEFIGCTVEQQKWGGNDIPHALVVCGKYKVKNVEVHNWHTKIELEGIEGKFNSVCFKFDTDNSNTQGN
jgi:hypothetical protein